jgi:hypothetical protein
MIEENRKKNEIKLLQNISNDAEKGEFVLSNDELKLKIEELVDNQKKMMAIFDSNRSLLIVLHKYYNQNILSSSIKNLNN